MLPQETLEEWVGNLAVLPYAAERLDSKYAETGYEDDGLLVMYNQCVTAMCSSQIKLTERMISEGVDKVHTGTVMATLEPMPDISFGKIARLYRDGKRIL